MILRPKKIAMLLRMVPPRIQINTINFMCLVDKRTLVAAAVLRGPMFT